MFKEINMFNHIKTDKMEKEHDNHENNHEELFNQEWQKSQENEIIKSLKSGEKIEDKLFQLPGFKKAFDHELTCLDCSDGRVCSGPKMALAGEGILLGLEDLAILERAIKEKGLTISGHENCGAAGIAHPGEHSDDFGYEYAKELASNTGNAYKEVHHDEFKCEVHNERALVLEGTGRFDVANLEGFPGQFISSASHFGLSTEYQKTEAKALINIALGSHSFGERFDKENPFYLIVSAKDAEQLAATTKMAEEVATEFDGRVKVSGFIAPQEVLTQQV
jgi:hypothetical protein